ncbi:nucleic acid-binding protein [Dothidotthia symphoricarpi CBS 119687]|uniref:Nucleic acid-binding protein n=1 Tax=Dothidotthia symphoricarpi CBS 119687 TaxID=1392245 RepID=A0A6A6ABZ8_9PLEO|nr:nucleic acid-binding protein [Dothidotthia symphoricarpi CBS 119687]KAF2129310.1 nucleic acid-binding protein [Dothidotthia symphoricarpi CBS 119687]
MPRPKRNVLATMDSTLTPPDTLPPSNSLARITKAEGKNLYNAELPDGTEVLVELEAKFRSTIWIKRGSYVLVDTAAMADRENKLDGEIVNVVRDEKAWRKMAYWPKEFAKKSTYIADSDEEESTVGKMPPADSDEE